MARNVLLNHQLPLGIGGSSAALFLLAFGEDRLGSASDFNDMHRHRAAVGERIAAQVAAHAAQEPEDAGSESQNNRQRHRLLSYPRRVVEGRERDASE